MKQRNLYCALVAGLLASGTAQAHEFAPTLIDVHQKDADTFVLRGHRTTVTLTLSGCTRSEEVLTCAGGVWGREVHVSGLDPKVGQAIVKLHTKDEGTRIVTLSTEAPSVTLLRTPSRLGTMQTYLRMGVEHIVSGIDHLVFVLGLFLVCMARRTSRTRALLYAITAFTLAHSLTLALTVLDVVHVPAAPVEAVIALSIVFLAHEVLLRSEEQRAPPATYAFGFGLLHGFGFAGALTDAGLPSKHIGAALFSFNIGVELGQLAFVCVVAGIFWVLATAKKTQVIRIAAGYAIGAAGVFWTLDRVSNILQGGLS